MKPSRKTAFYIILIISAAVLFIVVYKNSFKFGRIISPILIAVIVTYLVKPLADFLKNRRLSPSLAIIIVYILFAGLFVTAAFFLVPQILSNARDLLKRLPDLIEQFRSFSSGMVSIIKDSDWSADVKNSLFSQIDAIAVAVGNIIQNSLNNIMNALVNTVTIIFQIAVGMVIAFYFLKDAESFKAAFYFLIPRKWRMGASTVVRDISQILSGFIQGQLITALIVGIMEITGLIIVGTDYPFLLGMFGGISNVIPYFGPLIGAVPAVALALIKSPVRALWTALVFIIVQQIDNTFISPKIIEGKLGLHPVVTIIVVLAGGELFGITGMFLAVPAAAVINVIVKRSVDAIA